MRSVIVTLLIIVGGMSDIDGASATEQSNWVASEVVTSYVSGTSPTLILGLDNNLEICLALREPKTVSELRSAGVPVTDSQLVLLQLWRLIERSADGKMRCAVPVLEAPVTTELEVLARAVTEDLLQAVGTDIDGYIETVRESGWPGSSHALLGSFVLDGLVWRALEREGAIENADASAMPTGSEHWSGITWITLPPPVHKLGTNSHQTDSGTLSMTWTPSSLPAQEALMDPDLLEELTAMASGRLEPQTADHARVLEQLGLIHNGELAVPVIGPDSPVCMEGGRLAVQVADALVASEPLREMMRLTGAQSPAVALIMAYHWVYPRLMSRLEGGTLTRPAVLDGKPGASLGPTVYVVANDAACVRAAE